VSIVALALFGGNLTGLVPGGGPREAYYMTIFGCQDDYGNPFTSHCFATFVRVRESGQPLARPEVELKHINWFTPGGHETGIPHGLMVDGKPGDPEPGENRDTACGFMCASKHKLTVYKLGPYEIEKSLYDRAQRQIDLLSGRVPGRKVLYKQLDYGFRENGEVVALNCIHAISDIVREPAPINTGFAFGREAALLNLRHLKPWIKDPSRVHGEVWKTVWAELWRARQAPPVKIVDVPPTETAPGLVAEK
jgi:hypothetical protein